tara:strand:+ start:826 stop:1119 length:294 start_codon:yes stop_codon:yes gene_type:complete
VLKKDFKKIDLVKDLSLKTGYSQSYSKKIIDDLINIFIQNIKSGNLNLKNIGSFKVLNKKERIGRNPKTKEEFIITSRKSLSFTSSKKIIDNLNKIT